jgi:hypothetical protein
MSYYARDPAWPSRKELAAVDAATERDIADLDRLEKLEAILNNAIRAVRAVEPLRHPERRWDGEDLLAVLKNELLNARGERHRVNGPLVLDPEDV